MSFATTYAARRVSAHDALHHVHDHDTIVVPTGAGEPPTLLEALSEQRRSFHGVEVSSILPVRPFGYFDAETREHVRSTGYFLGEPNRKAVHAGWAQVRPCNFSEMPGMVRRGLFPADVVFAMASPMDPHGFFALSLGVDYTLAAIEKARAVVLEVNPRVPFTHGNCHVHIDQVTAVVEDERPLLEVAAPPVDAVERAIGEQVADLIPDGVTLQIGYGAIPDAVVRQLTGRRDLGIATEMMGEGILDLVESGAVTNRGKTIDRGVATATFALGSQRLYDWMDRNPGIEMHPADHTNDPYVMGQIDRLHAINGTIEIDFMGQCCSESIGPLPYSGTGGQSDFVRAANRSAGGKAIIVAPSTAKGGTVSRIVPTLRPGAHVTTSKNDVDYVVTEYGVAQLRGTSNQERVRRLLAIAHPDFRDELGERAQQMHLM